MKTTLELLAEKHTTWFNIVKSFGCNQDTAEDIVQEMYIPAFEELDNIDEFYRLVNSSLDKLHWYDKKIYQYIEGGESIKGLSDKTKISYYSVYNTYNKVKKKLEKLIIKNLKKDI